MSAVTPSLSAARGSAPAFQCVAPREAEGCAASRAGVEKYRKDVGLPSGCRANERREPVPVARIGSDTRPAKGEDSLFTMEFDTDCPEKIVYPRELKA